MCSLKEIEQTGSIIDQKVVVQLQIARDASSFGVRRDLVQEQELQIKTFLQEKISGVCKTSWCFQFNVLVDDGAVQSAMMAGACDLLMQQGVYEDLWACLLLFHESLDGDKQWIVDPSFEESCTLSNNLLLVSRVGDKYSLQVGADVNRTSFAVQQATTLNYKSSAAQMKDVRAGFKIAQRVCELGLKELREKASDEAYTVKMSS